MSIWLYADTIRDKSLVRSTIEFSVCPFCDSNLELLRDDSEDRGGHGEYETNVDRYWICPVCGWWKGYSSYRHTDHGMRSFLELGAAAVLRDLDLTDLSLPIEEVRSYLAAKYESRFGVHPRLLELTVASVFKDHGHRAEATAYSNDGGIDVLVTDRDG